MIQDLDLPKYLAVSVSWMPKLSTYVQVPPKLINCKLWSTQRSRLGEIEGGRICPTQVRDISMLRNHPHSTIKYQVYVGRFLIDKYSVQEGARHSVTLVISLSRPTSLRTFFTRA